MAYYLQKFSWNSKSSNLRRLWYKENALFGQIQILVRSVVSSIIMNAYQESTVSTGLKWCTTISMNNFWWFKLNSYPITVIVKQQSDLVFQCRFQPLIFNIFYQLMLCLIIQNKVHPLQFHGCPKIRCPRTEAWAYILLKLLV